MAVTHHTPLATTGASRAPLATIERPDPASFEAPLHTVPYPVHALRDVCLETRDLYVDDDASIL